MNEQMNELNTDQPKASTANEIPSQEKIIHRTPLRLAACDTGYLLWERVGVNRRGPSRQLENGNVAARLCFLQIIPFQLDPSPLVSVQQIRFTQLPRPDQWRWGGILVLTVHSCASPISADDQRQKASLCLFPLDAPTAEWGALQGQSLYRLISTFWR